MMIVIFGALALMVGVIAALALEAGGSSSR
jgi:hypothetical protein